MSVLQLALWTGRCAVASLAATSRCQWRLGERPSRLSRLARWQDTEAYCDMATWQQVSRIALSMPLASERGARGRRQWRVKDKLFVWERPLRAKEAQSLGERAPRGPILAARVEHLHAKEALIASEPELYFTTYHFEGFPAVLARLDRLKAPELRELITEAWLARAPKRLVQEYLDRAR
jgi:hypothetical protein